MRIIEIQERTEMLINQLLKVWEDSVKEQNQMNKEIPIQFYI